MTEQKSKLRPYLSPEFSGTTTEQNTAFKAYNKLLETVDPKRIVSALSARALDLSFQPTEDLDKKIIRTAEGVIDTTDNGTQIGFGEKSSIVEKTWEIIHKDPDHQAAATRFNTLKYEPNADPVELKNRCQQRGYATLAAVARIHEIANQKDNEEEQATQASPGHAIAA